MLVFQLPFTISLLSLWWCVRCVYMKREQFRGDASPPSSIHYVISTWPVPLIISNSTNIPPDSFKLSSSSHSLSSYCWKGFQEKLIILYYNWIEQKGNYAVSSLCFLFLYLPRVLTSGEFIVSSCQMSDIWGWGSCGSCLLPMGFFTTASWIQLDTNTSYCISTFCLLKA